MVTESSPRKEFWQGFKSTIPLIVGAVPFGIIFGALAIATGISPMATIGLSLIVFAGASQMMGVGLVGQQTPIPIIWLTTFIVNARHALYATTVAPYTKHLPQRWQLILGYMLTDEAFAVAIQRYNQPDTSPHKHWYFLGSALSLHVFWQLSTIIGILAGSNIQDPAAWGLDFTMTVTFTAMLVLQIKTRPILVCVVVSAVVAILANGMTHQLGLLVASICGIVAGIIAESQLPKPDISPKTLEDSTPL